MNAMRILFLGSLLLFMGILGAGMLKKRAKARQAEPVFQTIELALPPQLPLAPPPPPPLVAKAAPKPPRVISLEQPQPSLSSLGPSTDASALNEEPVPSVDRMGMLFNPYGPRLSIVQTIRYTPRVNWVKDRLAWIVDYASHYQTSKHFISRSLTGKQEYFSNDINPGDRFNVLRNDIAIEFYLVTDATCGKMQVYYCEPAKKEMVLLKTYDVVLGRRDELSPSGCLTPLGKYKLGSRIAVYKPGMMGSFHKQKVEMIQVFGTRWIPFEDEISGCSAPAKGYGIHGSPWVHSDQNQWQEKIDAQGAYSSDGCIRLATPDIEELFSIIITRPTSIEIVKSFDHANLPYPVVEPTIVVNP